MTFFKRKIPPVAIVLAACLILFLLKSHELRSLDREIAPALAELTPTQPLGMNAFIRVYMADPFGKAIGLSERQLQICRRVSLLIPAYQSAAAWRNNALFIGLCTLLFLGLRRYTSNPAYRTYRNLAQAFLRRMAAKAEPFMTQARQRAGMATPHAVHNIVACPHCPQKLRVPAGKGRIRVTCPGCGTTFECLT